MTRDAISGRLGPGRILLLRLNRLYEVNADLEEKLVLDSPQELLWVSVTPGGFAF